MIWIPLWSYRISSSAITCKIKYECNSAKGNLNLPWYFFSDKKRQQHLSAVLHRFFAPFHRFCHIYVVPHILQSWWMMMMMMMVMVMTTLMSTSMSKLRCWRCCRCRLRHPHPCQDVGRPTCSRVCRPLAQSVHKLYGQCSDVHWSGCHILRHQSLWELSWWWWFQSDAPAIEKNLLRHTPFLWSASNPQRTW